MEKPSILNAFEREYSKENFDNTKQILIDINSLMVKKDTTNEWLPGAEELMEELSSFPENTILLVWNRHFNKTQIEYMFRKSRIFCTIVNDPIDLNDYEIIISPKTGIIYTDFPAIKEFLKKLE